MKANFIDLIICTLFVFILYFIAVGFLNGTIKSKECVDTLELLLRE